MLVAEDEEPIALVYKSLLESIGHEVEIAKDGIECLQMIENAKKPYDIVILDYRMPRRDGVAVAAEIQSRWPRQKILLISAFVDDVVHESVRSLEHPVVCLQKPIDLDAFGSIVESEAEADKNQTEDSSDFHKPRKRHVDSAN
ncbi:MAG: response regulator [Nitrososphaera sp.]|jgi:CheY-like chemotaxis protein